MDNPRKELNTYLQALQHISRLHFYIRGLFLLEMPFFSLSHASMDPPVKSELYLASDIQK